MLGLSGRSWRNLQNLLIVTGVAALLLLCIFALFFGLYVLTRADPRAEATQLLLDLKNFFDIVQSLATVGAVILGGIWSYVLFQGRRERLPRASVKHRVSSRPLSDGSVALFVTILVSNPSDVLLVIRRLEVWVQQVLPVSDTKTDTRIKEWKNIPEDEEMDTVKDQLGWRLIAVRERTWQEHKREIEPGESHQFWFDFLIEGETRTIRVYSHVREFENPKLGWTQASLHDIKEGLIKQSEFTELPTATSD